MFAPSILAELKSCFGGELICIGVLRGKYAGAGGGWEEDGDSGSWFGDHGRNYDTPCGYLMLDAVDWDDY